MNVARIRSVLLSKQLRLVTLIILLLRVVQTIGYVTGTMGTIDDARFMDYQTVSFATFVLAPLFLVMALCVVRTYVLSGQLARALEGCREGHPILPACLGGRLGILHPRH